MTRTARRLAACSLGLALALPAAAGAEPASAPDAATGAPSDAAQREQEARQVRIDALVTAIRAEQRALLKIVQEPVSTPPAEAAEAAAATATAEKAEPVEPVEPVEPGEPVEPAAEGSTASPRVPPIPLRPEIRLIAESLPSLQRELHELGGDRALLDKPLLWP